MLFYFGAGVAKGGAEADALWSEGFGVASFAVGLAIVVARVCCVVSHSLVAGFAGEARFVKGLVYGIDGFVCVGRFVALGTFGGSSEAR